MWSGCRLMPPVPNVTIDVYAAYTNNPPCGAMRGFGAVQACFAYESQMDELARRLGMDPAQFRIRNAMSQGSVMPTGQVVDSAAPVAELLRRVSTAPMPPSPPPGHVADLREMPGGVSNTTHGEGVRHVIQLSIEDSKNREEAMQLARAIAHSPLVKTAWAGADPNWGRILAACGNSVSASLNYVIDTGLRQFTLPVSATACFP